ncbi:hypothetical protein BG005_004202 [Podila minutissima]|nr:hypothetical protein BG005_004202 [Podila minutissima]
MKKNNIPENLLTTNLITRSDIKIGGKTFNRLIEVGIFSQDGKVIATVDDLLQASDKLKGIKSEHAEKRHMLIHGEPNQRLDVIMQDVADAEEALLLLTQLKKYINLKFNNEIVALTEAVSSLNIKTTHN